MRRKNNNKKYILILAILALSIGYALISTNLTIGGRLITKGGNWNIHWDDESIVEDSNATIVTPAHVTDSKKIVISFQTQLKQPGDYYEFTADAVNEGTVDGIISDIKLNLYDIDGETSIDKPYYINYSFTHEDGSTIENDEIILAGTSEKYKFRIEYDKDIDELPDNPTSFIPEVEIDIEQDETLNNAYQVKFDGNGGTPSKKSINVKKGEAIGSLPTAVKTGEMFDGWYTELTGGTKITKDTIPSSNVTYYAHWITSYTTFDTGKNVNGKLKTLAAGSTVEWNEIDQSITGFVRSSVAPGDGVSTSVISVEGQSPIYAWYDNGIINYYTEAGTIYFNEDSSNFFSNFKSIANLDLSDIKTINLVNANSMFSACNSIETLNISTWDTSNVTDMGAMFSSCSSLTSLNLSSFDTGNVTQMGGMFSGLSSITTLDLSNFDTSKVTSMSGMFASSSLLTSLDLSNFDTSKVTNMGGMFGGLSSLTTLKLNNWNFTSFDVYSLSSQLALNSCTSLRTFELDNAVFGYNLYSGFSGLSSVQSISLENVDTSHVTNMYNLFSGCSSIVTLDLTSFDTSNVTDMSSMFGSMSALTTIIVSDSFDTTKVTSSSNMFYGDYNLVGGRGTVFDSSHIDKEYARYDKGVRRPGYFNRAGEETVTITFNPNEGEVNPTTKQAYSLDPIGTLPIPTREGYGFLGWYTELTGGIKIDSTTIVQGATTYYAHWIPDITINYDGNSGTFENDETTNTINYKYNEIDEVVYSHTPNIDDDGVASGAYSNNMSQNDVVTISGADSLQIEVWFSTEGNCDWLAIYPTGVTPDQNNYAQATISNGRLMGGNSTSKPSDNSEYHKIFTVDGDTAQLYFRSDSSAVYYGYYAIITPLNKKYKGNNDYQTPYKEGYKFLGWNTKDDGSGKSYLDENDVFIDLENIPNNSILYAIWEKQDPYEITYDANNGTFDNSTTTNKITYTYARGNTVKYSHTPNIDDFGNANGQYANNLSLNDVVTIPGATQIHIDVWFLTESDNCDWLAIYPAGVTPTQSNFALATISGGKIAGHGSYTNTDVPNRSDENFHRSYTVDGDTAQFYFRSDSSSVYYGYYAVITAESVGYHGDSEYKVPTRNEHVFLGWNTENDGSGTDFANESEVINGLGGLSHTDTIYAKWYELQKYTITFDANGGEVDPSSKVVLEGNAIGELPTPTWEDHRFDGWYTDISGGTRVYDTYVPTETKAIYAHWTKIHTVTYDANGGTVDPEFVKVINGSAIGTLPTPTKANNVFDGWWTGLTDGTQITSSYRPTDDVIIYAHWIPDIQVTFNANEGQFDGGSSTNSSSYSHANVTINEYSHTPNINDEGVANGTYASNLSINDVVTIPEVSKVNIEIYYSTESTAYDWVAIYPKNVTPTESNYTQATISNGKLGGGKRTTKSTATRRTYTVNDNTVQFFFKSDSRSNYYGYYAIVSATIEKYLSNDTYLEPSNSGYTFGGWNTEPDGTGTNYANEEEIEKGLVNYSEDNITLYAMWKLNLNDTSWDTIAIIEEEGRLCEKFNIGDTKNVEMDLNEDGVNETYPVRLANCSRPSECSNSSFSQTACGGVFEFVDVISEHRMNPYGNSWPSGTDPVYKDGWEESEGREYLNTDIYNALPSDLQRNIINTYTVSGYTTDSDHLQNYVTTDKIYLLSYKEIYGRDKKVTSGDTIFYQDTSSDNSRHLDYYKKMGVTMGDQVDDDTVTAPAVKTYNGSGSYWWLRSALSWGHNLFTSVADATSGGETAGGNHSWCSSDWEIGMSPAFRVGVPHESGKYLVTYKANGGVVSPAYSQVTIGDSIGQLPTPIKENYVFEGWYTGVTDGIKVDSTFIPTDDTKLYAHWRLNSFITSTWDDIIDDYNNGDLDDLEDAMEQDIEREIKMDLDDDGTDETYHIRIANLSTPAECSTTGFSQTACGFVLEFTDIIDRHRMNFYENDSNITTLGVNGNGGWEYSDMRAYLNGTIYAYQNVDYSTRGIYNKLPSSLKNKIINTTVVSGHGNHDSSNFTTIDKLYLLSSHEIWEDIDPWTTQGIDYQDTAYYSTRQLDYYHNKGVAINSGIIDGTGKINIDVAIKKNAGSAFGWWLRNPMVTNNMFMHVDNTGDCYRDKSDGNWGVSPAFRIG